eukprot:gene6023-6724_t
MFCLLTSTACLPRKRDARAFDQKKYDVKDPLSYCSGLSRLNRRQSAFCIKNSKIVKIFEQGFKTGIQSCINKFKNNSFTRWNCTNTAKAKRSNIFFGIPMAVGTKEAAVMQAFGAAGMFMALTRECIKGNIAQCSSSSMYRVCNAAKSDGSTKKSCSVINWDRPRNIFYSFMSTGTGGKYWKHPNRFMQKFDRAIGIVAVMESTIKGCDCSRNGIMNLPCLSSSSCSEQLPIMEDIATNLFDKYLKAKRFTPAKPSTMQFRATYPPEISDGKIVYIEDPNIPPGVTGRDLIFFKDSSMHCGPRATDNWAGIGGRPCRPDVKAFDSCSILCCGFGYMIVSEIKRSCKIRNVPVLSVECETQEVYKYICKFEGMVTRRSKRSKFAVPLSSLHRSNSHLLKNLGSTSG